ncbi:MAG: hypothetical protein EOM80_17415 [Erysipelotrichia bacterium]|nr:hypothetical protein [Erysipelotrichia bacterium]
MKDMTGKKFGKWIVLHRDYQAKIGTGVHTRWICQCECGQIKSVDGKTIRRGKSTQCTKCKNRKDFKITEEPLYKLLSGMKDRCYNESNGRFARYGGRGICVCEEWLQSYQKFKEWAMENGYIQGHRLTIERIDNDDGYNPNNCRFATYAEQSRNKSNNHYVFIDGKKMILMDALRLAGTPPSTYKTRIKLGWDENDAIWGRNKEAKKE